MRWGSFRAWISVEFEYKGRTARKTVQDDDDGRLGIERTLPRGRGEVETAML